MRLVRNLVLQSLFPGTFQGRDEKRLEWEAGVEVHDALRPVLRGNQVAGAARTGFHVAGESCDVPSEWHDNVAHSVLVGVMMITPKSTAPCARISGFRVYKAFDYGVYAQTGSGVTLTDFVSLDNGVGLYPMIIGPRGRKHQYADKPIVVSAQPQCNFFLESAIFVQQMHDPVKRYFRLRTWCWLRQVPSSTAWTPCQWRLTPTSSTARTPGHGAPAVAATSASLSPRTQTEPTLLQSSPSTFSNLTKPYGGC